MTTTANNTTAKQFESFTNNAKAKATAFADAYNKHIDELTGVNKLNKAVTISDNAIKAFLKDNPEPTQRHAAINSRLDGLFKLAANEPSISIAVGMTVGMVAAAACGDASMLVKASASISAGYIAKLGTKRLVNEHTSHQLLKLSSSLDPATEALLNPTV